jgi:hypothetical protein
MNSPASPAFLPRRDSTSSEARLSPLCELKHPETNAAPIAVKCRLRGAVLLAEEFERLLGAHQFLRRLINAQRMLHGSAKDLLIPPEGSEELVHLARQMRFGEENGGSALLAEIRKQSGAVRPFIRGLRAT